MQQAHKLLNTKPRKQFKQLIHNRNRTLTPNVHTKMKILCVLSVLCVLITGCQEYTVNSKTGERVPRYAGRIQVALYDQTTRPENPNFEVFARPEDVKRPYKIIALLAHEANPEDEAMMMNAIAYRAKKLGADAMIVLNQQANNAQVNQVVQIANNERKPQIYRANAIIYTP